MKSIKNNRGFTLIELLAVIIILAVIMTIAIPNVIATLDKNKRESFIKDAKRAITSAEYTIRSDTQYEYPDANSAVVFPLSNLKNLDLEISPFDTYYSYNDSFVAITKESVGDYYEYVYYVHLVSCTDEECLNTEDNSVSKNRGINLVKDTELDSSNRFELVQKGDDVNLELLRDTSHAGIMSVLKVNHVVVYD